ncbi:MAG: glycosyltransferase, partial [Candidatus Latescibacterota bacterium]
MRVCMLTTGFPRFRGDLFGAFVLELARELVCQGVTVEVVAPHQAGLPTRELLDGVEVRRFRYLVPAGWQRVAYGGGIPTNLQASALVRCQVPLFMAGFTLAARRAAARADLVHCHWTASGIAGIGAVLGRRRPLVLTVRGSDLHLQGDAAGRLNRRVWRKMDRVAAVSQDLADRLVQAGVAPDCVTVLHNGVSERFAPVDRQAARQRLGLPPDRFVLLFVGLLVPVKGLDLLLEALGQLAD